MNAKERYLAVFDENERYKLDRVPIHVQYIREEFIEQHKTSLLNSHDGKLFSSDYYDVPFILGFDAVFAPFPLSYKFRPIRILTDQGIRVRVREDGQGFSQKTSYYEGGYVANMQA